MNSQGDPWSNWLFGHISGPAEEGQSFPRFVSSSILISAVFKVY